MSEKKQPPKAKKKIRLRWKLLPLAIAAPAIMLTVVMPKITESPTDSEWSSVSDSDVPELDPNAGEYVDPQKENDNAGGIAVPGWNSLSIPKNQKEVAVDFYNPVENEGQYQLTFELRLPDESEQGYEVLYKSGLVDPGLHIQNITLSHELEAGIYDATLHVQPYRMDEQKSATNNADMQTKLIVE